MDIESAKTTPNWVTAIPLKEKPGLTARKTVVRHFEVYASNRL
jgi:hypothetical protein